MNNLNDLNEVLFKQLEALDDPNMTDEEFDKRISSLRGGTSTREGLRERRQHR